MSLHTALLLVALAAQATTQSQGNHSTWPDGAAVVLRPPRFKGGLRFCSRPAPQGVSGFWEVQAEDVAAIDALDKYLRETGIDKRLTLPVSKYQRQYLGFLRGTERFIYINAFPARFRSAVANSSKEMPRICDGGTINWGIEYDVTKRVFLAFAPNY
jgi:hypothetical protein